MLAQRLYANRFDLPLSLKGRSPFWPGYGLILPYGVKALDTLARLGSPDGKEPIDREVAAAYLRLAPEAAGKEPYLSLGVKAEPEPNGTFVMPYAALLAHRRDDWLVCVRGQSRYCWGSERQARRNCYAPFMSFGALEILAGGKPVTCQGKRDGRSRLGLGAFRGDHRPSTPAERTGEGLAREQRGDTLARNLCGRALAPGPSGHFHHGDEPDGSRRTARSSRARGAGSSATTGSSAWAPASLATWHSYPTQTTLCQQSLRNTDPKEIRSTSVDGADPQGLPRGANTGPGQAPLVFRCPADRLLRARRPECRDRGKHQKSRDVNDWADTEGDFLIAWIDHGKAPKDAGYEYLVVVRATPEAMQKIVAQPPYRVLQRDDAAHIVWNTSGRRWGCAFFTPQKEISHAVAKETLSVKAVDRPCLVMTHAAQDGQLDVSVADPDLNLQPGGANKRADAARHLSRKVASAGSEGNHVCMASGGHEEQGAGRVLQRRGNHRGDRLPAWGKLQT